MGVTVVAVGFAVGCGGAEGGASHAPRLLVDGQSHDASITASANRQHATVTLAQAAVALFGATLTAVRYDLDLSSVPNDDPNAYDIALVAACAKEAELSFDLGHVPQTEADASDEPSYHQLAVDGCAMQPSAIRLSGQTNISKLDAVHVEMAVIFALEQAGERHELLIDRLNLAY